MGCRCCEVRVASLCMLNTMDIIVALIVLIFDRALGCLYVANDLMYSLALV